MSDALTDISKRNRHVREMQSAKTGEPTCTVKCPAIRKDPINVFYCRIRREYVAPKEHRGEYGFDTIREGKVVRTGYETPCDAMQVFGVGDIS